MSIYEFILNKSVLYITNKPTDNKYCDAKGNICKI